MEAIFNPPPSYLDSAHLHPWWTFQFLKSCSLLGGFPLPASQRSCLQLIYARRISSVTLDNIEHYVLKWLEPDVFSELHVFTYLTLDSHVPNDLFVRYALRLKYCGVNRKHSSTYADDCDLFARRVTGTKFCTPSIVRAQGVSSVVVAYKLCRQWDETDTQVVPRLARDRGT